MLNIQVRSAEGVERYFDRELAVSDYLMKEPGVWAGQGAGRLDFETRSSEHNLSHCCEMRTQRAASSYSQRK